jgi:UDP-N-acetylmuramoylalanine--D-glutamate ligase
MREATQLAKRLVDPGGVVLLSPAAPSFNQYDNFEERGDDFATLALRA